MKKAPKNYIHWLFTDHYFNNGQGILKFIGQLFGIFLAFYIPGPVIEEYLYHDAALPAVIGIFIATYGFCFGLMFQPYGIYKRLHRMDWWDK